MDLRSRRETLLERAENVEEKASREKNTQAQDLMRALALLYREMGEELDDSGLFERRFDGVVCADGSISAGQSHQCCISAEAHLHRR